MARQQISTLAKEAMKGDRGAANRPAHVDERQTRRRRQGRARAAEVQQGAPAAAATLPEAEVDTSVMSTDNKTAGRAASQPRARPKRAGEQKASSADRPPASTKRALLIGMLERAEGASVAEIGQRLGWLPHTVRAAITGLRHAGREVTRSKNESGQTVYRLAPIETQDR